MVGDTHSECVTIGTSYIVPDRPGNFLVPTAAAAATVPDPAVKSTMRSPRVVNLWIQSHTRGIGFWYGFSVPATFLHFEATGGHRKRLVLFLPGQTSQTQFSLYPCIPSSMFITVPWVRHVGIYTCLPWSTTAEHVRCNTEVDCPSASVPAACPTPWSHTEAVVLPGQ